LYIIGTIYWGFGEPPPSGGAQFLLPTGEGGAKRRMRGVNLGSTLFANPLFASPHFSHPLCCGRRLWPVCFVALVRPPRRRFDYAFVGLMSRASQPSHTLRPRDERV